MRIGVDIRPLLASPYGGVAEYCRNLLPALFVAGADHEFVLFSNSFKGVSPPHELLSARNVTWRPFGYPNKLLSFTTRFASFPKVDKLVGGVDVWFSPHMLPAPTGRGVPRVTTFHDLSFERFPYFFDMRRRVWHSFINPRAQAHASSRIIAVSEATRQDIIALYGVAPSRVKVVYPGVPFHPASKSQDRLEDFPYILSLCTLEPRKNLVAAITAFERAAPIVKGHHLVIAGPRGWNWRGIERAIADSPYRSRIHILGAVSSSRASALYERASLFIYPSFYEGFGFPPLEAMAQGVPVIASMTSSLPEVVGDAGVLVDPHRVDTIARLIVEILGDTQLSDELSRQGRERASHFSWERAARETLGVLEEAFLQKEE